MLESDYENFAALMLQISTAAIGKKEKPSNEQINFYFECLKDLPFDRIKTNAIGHFKTGSGFFPAVSELRGANDNTAALRDLQELENVTDAVSGNCFSSRLSAIAIGNHFRARGKEYMIPLALQFAPDIQGQSNPSATRAQFLKAWQSMQNRAESVNMKALPETNEPKRLSEILSGILPKIAGESQNGER